MLPHISPILEHLNITMKCLKESSGGKKKSRPVLPSLELSVLSKISPFVSHPEHSVTLIKVLLPCLYISQKEDAENSTLRAIKNLLSNVSAPSTFLKPLSKLFSRLGSRSSRQCLCEVFSRLAELDVSLSKLAVILSQINSWDSKRLEEPDYSVRLSGFSDASRLVKDGELTGEQIAPVLHNCIHYVLQSEDLSIRDSAGSCLTNIVQAIAVNQRAGEFDELVLNCVVPACKRALKSKNEVRDAHTSLQVVSLLCFFSPPFLPSFHSSFSSFLSFFLSCLPSLPPSYLKLVESVTVKLLLVCG